MRLAALTGGEGAEDLAQTLCADAKDEAGMQATTAPTAAPPARPKCHNRPPSGAGTLRQPVKAAVFSSAKSRLRYAYLWIVSAAVVVAVGADSALARAQRSRGRRDLR